MHAIAPGLLEVQRAMRESLVQHRDVNLHAHIVANGLDAPERLDIYRNTLASVLTNALRLSYPAVKQLVGDDFFEGAARIFIAADPPRSACLDDYGEGFPEFLERFGPARSLAYLPDVARLEWAVNHALHAEDASPLEGERLGRLPALENVLSLVAHPSIMLIRSKFPVDAIWRAVLDHDDAGLRAVDLDVGPVWLLVERIHIGVNVQRMSDTAWRFAAALCSGRPLRTVLHEETDFDPAVLLADHFSKGRFVDVRLS
jgi:putative DNA-binding protein